MKLTFRHSVNLIYEHNCGSFLSGLCKQLPDAHGSHSHIQLHKLTGTAQQACQGETRVGVRVRGDPSGVCACPTDKLFSGRKDRDGDTRRGTAWHGIA